MDAAHIVKGRRTKRRQRQPEPPPSSSSSEEEDMANCLILLAQGQPPDSPIEQNKGNAGNGGFCLYECKTCNKCFRSFQALGGHRTSHKKPKLLAQPVQEKKTEDRDQESIQLSISSHSNKGIGKKKVHECTICGSEFASGQALGGHMRRHRPAATLPEVKSQRSNFLIDLDLNLPASAEEATNGADLPSIVLLTTALVDCQN